MSQTQDKDTMNWKANATSENKKPKKSVVIIGAGPSGLAALKETLASGIDDVVLFEMGSSVGGLFAKDSTGAYDSVNLTTSNILTAFSDYPPFLSTTSAGTIKKQDDELKTKYSTKAEYQQYLESYAHHFGLLERIKLKHKVISALLRKDNGRWVVQVESQIDKKKQHHDADSLIVATGAFQVPNLPPEFLRLQQQLASSKKMTTTKVIHSSQYKNNQEYKGKNVLVVGAGESGVDIASDIANVAKRPILYSRSDVRIASRLPFHALKYSVYGGTMYDEYQMINCDSCFELDDDAGGIELKNEHKEKSTPAPVRKYVVSSPPTQEDETSPLISDATTSSATSATSCTSTSITSTSSSALDMDHPAAYLELMTTNRAAHLLPVYLFAGIRRLAFHLLMTGWYGKAAKMTAQLGYTSDVTPRRGNEQHQRQDQDELHEQCRLMFDQSGVATKNGRLFTPIFDGRMDLIVSKDVKILSSATSTENDDATPTRKVDIVFPTPSSKNGEKYKQGTQEIFQDVDIIVCCTGYKPEYSWIQREESGDKAVFSPNPRTWYKHCFPPNFGRHGTLVMLGHTRPHQGGLPACSELLARYAAMVINGTRQLPEDYASIALMEGKIEDDYYCASPHVKTLVDGPSFMESVAKLVGCNPKPPSFFKEPKRCIQYWCFPAWPCWYRQRCAPDDTAIGAVNTEALNQVLDPWDMNFFTLTRAGPILLTQTVLLLGYLPFIYFPLKIAVTFRRWLSSATTTKSSSSSMLLDPNVSGMGPGWLYLKPKIQVLHGNSAY